MLLTAKQTIALDLLENNYTKELIYGGSAGGGKSFLGCYWILKSALKYAGTRWLIGRSKLKSLKETTLNSFFDVCRIQGLTPDKHFNYNQQSGIIRLYNGSEIILKDLFTYPSDPNFDGLGSLEITGAFVDECNQISAKAWGILKSRIRYKLTEYNLHPKILGTCNPSKNWVYTDFFKPHRDGDLQDYKAFIQALATDNPNLSPHYLTLLNELDNASKQRLLYGNWEYDNSPDSLCNFESIVDIFTNEGVKPDPLKKAICADIALQGSDKMIILYFEGFVVFDIIVLPKADGKQAVQAIEDLANKYRVPKSRIVYDADGLGAYIGSYIANSKAFHNGAKALNNENYKNLKTQCIYRLADRINKGELYIKDQTYKQEIIQELEQLKRVNMDKDGKLEVLSKDAIKAILGHSPDFSDALMMREFLELKRVGFFV